MKLDPFKMFLFGVLTFFIILFLAYYSFKLTIQIYNDEFFEEREGSLVK